MFKLFAPPERESYMKHNEVKYKKKLDGSLMFERWPLHNDDLTPAAPRALRHFPGLPDTVSYLPSV